LTRSRRTPGAIAPARRAATIGIDPKSVSALTARVATIFLQQAAVQALIT